MKSICLLLCLELNDLFVNEVLKRFLLFLDVMDDNKKISSIIDQNRWNQSDFERVCSPTTIVL